MSTFYKLSASGNDFLALVEPESKPTPRQIRAWCRRGLSLGADGVFVLERMAGGARMHYFNGDGAPADLCLNGTGCAARLAFHLGWAEDSIEVETGVGPIIAKLTSPTSVALGLEVPKRPEAKEIALNDDRLSGWTIRVGVPHFVLTWPQGLTQAPVTELGPQIRSHAEFGAEGTNVNFVWFTDRHALEIRSFERGVEAETMACGTGVMAASATGLHLDLLDLPVRAITLGGFLLEVEATENDTEPAQWLLKGDARILSEGKMTIEAEALPSSPEWSVPGD